MPFAPVIPPHIAVTAPAPPRITKVRVGYQSPVTKSAYPVNQEKVRVFVLIWVAKESEPYSFEAMANDGRVPIWMTGTEGLGISGTKMVYTERGETGDGKDAANHYIPERLPVKTWPLVGGTPSAGVARVRVWPAKWARPSVSWFRVRHKIATQQAMSFGAQHRSFRMDREAVGGWKDKLGVEAQLERGVHRYVAVVTSGLQSISSVDAPVRTWFSQDSFKDAWATRIAVRDSAATNDPFLQYASIFLGTPYSYGGYSYGGATGNDGGLSAVHGMDCSGLVTAAFFHARYKYEKGVRKGNRTSTSAMGSGGGSVPTTKTTKAKLVPGDIMNYPNAHVRIVWQYTPGRDTYFGIESAPPECRIKSFPVYDAKYQARHIPLRDTADYKRKALLAALETIVGNGLNPLDPDIISDPSDVKPDKPGGGTATVPTGAFDKRVFINGNPLTLPVAPVMKSGAIQITQRPILAAGGFSVDWFSEGTGANLQTGLTAVKNGGAQNVRLTTKQTKCVVNGVTVTLFTPPLWVENQVVASVAIFKKLGWTVTPVGRKIYIRTN